MVIPCQLNMSTTVHEETLMEEVQSPPKAIMAHMTLRDVSAIEKETEMETDMNNPDLSVSLLPFIPTVYPEERQGDHNKSIGSTISDKTFVKTSLKPFSSEEDEDEEESTVVEESFLVDSKENTRPLLLTADQSIRIPDRSSRQEKLSLANKSNEDIPKIKLEKVSFHEPLKARKFNQDFPPYIHNHLLFSLDNQSEKNRLGKTFLLNNHTFDAEKSDYVRPTIIINDETNRLPTIASADS